MKENIQISSIVQPSRQQTSRYHQEAIHAANPTTKMVQHLSDCLLDDTTLTKWWKLIHWSCNYECRNLSHK